jgi:prepilin signal peptidase PulO-like enzyme (type II secretory pathway)
MFEFIGLLFDLFILGVLSVLLSCIFAGVVWLLFWGRRHPKRLILMAGLIPPISAGWLLFCAVLFTLFVPNQPDEFFGDFSEPLPHGYVLTGLGKMPEFSYFESTPPMMHQPPLLGCVKSLEQDGEVVYGAYGHLNQEAVPSELSGTENHGYFVFDTRNGQVKNFATFNELTAYARHPLHLVESQFFRSQDLGRRLLRQIENVIYFGPPIAATLLCLFFLIRFWFRDRRLIKTTPSLNSEV